MVPSAAAATAVLLLCCWQVALVGAAARQTATPASEDCDQFHFVHSDEEKVADPLCSFAPAQWSRISQSCSDLPANRQSPITIRLGACSHASRLQPLLLSAAWWLPRKFRAANSGRSVQATALSTDLTVSGGSLRTNYTVVQFHFHWGSAENMRSGVGSEHLLVDGRGQRVPTPAELHIVCRRADLSFTEAAGTEDGIAVIGVFLATAQVQGCCNRSSSSLLKLFKDFDSVAAPHGDAAEVELTLTHLLPADLSRFVGYDGSFTTPNCNPVVQWRLLVDAVHVSQEALLQFTKVFSDAERRRPLVNNFRPAASKIELLPAGVAGVFPFSRKLSPVPS